jgi:dolichol-phosphate mannosyltransferase
VFKWCLNRSYQYIFEMDADFSHDPNDLERLYLSCKKDGAQVAVGSRYVKGGQTENWPWDRQLYSKGGALYTKLLTWMPVQDPTAGFVCYKREVLEAINFDMISFVGYAFQIEMKFAAWKLGFIIKEVPIIFRDRKIGVSKKKVFWVLLVFNGKACLKIIVKGLKPAKSYCETSTH